MRLLFVLISVYSLAWECKAQEPLATLVVEVIDSLGLPIDSARLVLDRGGPDGKQELVENSVRVPPGHYFLRIEAPGFAGQEYLLRILQRRVFVRVALDISDVGAGHSNRVSGRIGGKLPSDQDIWVRLVPLVRNNLDMDYKIADTRNFEFVGMPNGEYLLLVLGGCRGNRGYPKLLAQSEVSVSGRTELVLNVEGAGGTQPCSDPERVK